MDFWEEDRDLQRLRDLHTLVKSERKNKNWAEVIFYPIDEPGTQFEDRRFLLQSMELLETLSKEIWQMGSRVHTTVSEVVDEKHNRAPRWSKIPDEMRKLWDKARPYVHIRNYGYGTPQGKTNLAHEMEDAKKYGYEVWFYNNDAILGTNRFEARMFFGLWAWKAGIAGVTAWTYPGARTVQYEAVREGIDDHKYLVTLENLIKKKAGTKDDRLKAKAFLDQLKKSIALDNDGYIYAWKQTFIKTMKKMTNTPISSYNGFSELKKLLADHILRLAKIKNT